MHRILVATVEDSLYGPRVAESAVDEEQPLKEAELCNGVVCCEGGLHPLLSADADANIRRLQRIPKSSASKKDLAPESLLRR